VKAADFSAMCVGKSPQNRQRDRREHNNYRRPHREDAAADFRQSSFSWKPGKNALQKAIKIPNSEKRAKSFIWILQKISHRKYGESIEHEKDND
jgi:hypothetical protein